MKYGEKPAKLGLVSNQITIQSNENIYSSPSGFATKKNTFLCFLFLQKSNFRRTTL